jgi:nucleoid-associated protein YgaU
MNPQDRDNRADNRDEKNREEKNRDERRKEKTDKPARLGKEAKIGAAVILLLLITLGVVVVMRLTKGDDKELASTSGADSETHKPLAAKDDPLFKDVNSRSFGSHSPTVVPPAKAAPMSPPAGFDSKLDRWKQPADKMDPRRAESRYAPTNPPSSPPKSAPGSRYEPLTSDPLPGLDPDTPGCFEKKKTDKLNEKMNDQVNELRLDPPDAKKRPNRDDPRGSVTTRRDFDRDPSSGFADAGSPPRHDKPRYDDRSAALLPPATIRDERSYDRDGGRTYSAAPASKYSDDFPRASTASYDRGKSRNFEAPSYSPPPRTDGKYEVQPMDNYSKISQALYGTPAYFKALAEVNRGKIGDENKLMPGDLISAPSVAELEKTYPELCPKASRRETQQSRMMTAGTQQTYRGRTYKVAEGDTLFNIARYELGKASRWAEIYELNREVLGKDYNYLTPGMQLMLPDGEKSDMLTRGKSNELYR